ncbi:MAG: hypothetical protein AAFS10_06795 [Myxococcota bacterium]
MTHGAVLLIIEDGDEYRRFFSRHLTDSSYHQARSYAACMTLLEDDGIEPDAFILDIRFDRVPHDDLIGDVEEIAEQLLGDPSNLEAAWRYLSDNQGYLILRELRDAGYTQPALMIADIPKRQRDNLGRLYGTVGVVPSFDRAAIQRELERLLGKAKP